MARQSQPRLVISQEKLRELGIPSSIQDATRVKGLGSNAYTVELEQKFCIIAVPNGGYVASVFLRVAHEYASAKGHPDTMVAHFEFLGRTRIGKAVLLVEEKKVGRTMSVLHISLYQVELLDKAPWVSSGAKPEVCAYITNADLSKEKGFTFKTGWVDRVASPPVDFGLLAKGQDPEWHAPSNSLLANVPALHHLEYYCLRSGRATPATENLWLRCANGDKFKQTDLAFVVDIISAYIAEGYRITDPEAPVPEGGFAHDTALWYPTLAMNLDIKKRLPIDGADWLRLRMDAKQMQNGRFDSEWTVFDTSGELVAISQQVALIVDATRNYANRENPNKPQKLKTKI